MDDAQVSPADASQEPAPENIATSERVVSAGRVWLLAILFAICAIAAAAFGTEKYREHHLPVKHRSTAMGNPMVVSGPSQAKADRQNALIVFGIQGATIAGALGLAGGLAQSSKTRTAAGVVAGIALGALAGVCASALLHAVYFERALAAEDGLSKDMVFPSLIRAILSGAIGLAAGLAFAVGFDLRPKRIGRIVSGAIIGGMLGALIYDVLGALVFPTDRTNNPIAQSFGARLMAIGCLDLLIAGLTVSFACAPEAVTNPPEATTA